MLVGIASVGFLNNLSAEEAGPCTAFLTTQDILDCVKIRYPALQRAEAETSVKEAGIITAAGRLNPEIDSRVLFGVGDHDSEVLSETNLTHPFELGGKRKARISKAESELAVSRSAAWESAEEGVLNTVLHLHRLRQIAVEKEMIQEVLSTYRRIIGFYQARLLLSPEQEVSLIVFQTASEEGLLKKNQLTSEEKTLQAAVQLSTGGRNPPSKSLLPLSPRHWPEKDAATVSTEGWAALRRAKAQLGSARASSRLAKAEAWPNVHFGPSLETDSPFGNHETAVGFAFSTSLPFYNRNQGKQAEAKREETAAQIALQTREREAQGEAARWVQSYRDNLQAFRRSKSGFRFHERHRQLEALFDRGLITSSLILEAHRQMLELQQEIHRTELRAIESLWKIYALEGRILEEKI